uniref:Uncharacterized protein n=1 Tax=Opuntia streptacantha TaxID=393608 RepID=A0A7C8YT83_OPUST
MEVADKGSLENQGRKKRRGVRNIANSAEAPPAMIWGLKYQCSIILLRIILEQWIRFMSSLVRRILAVLTTRRSSGCHLRSLFGGNNRFSLWPFSGFFFGFHSSLHLSGNL